jgi:hypothetical protein
LLHERVSRRAGISGFSVQGSAKGRDERAKQDGKRRESAAMRVTRQAEYSRWSRCWGKVCEKVRSSGRLSTLIEWPKNVRKRKKRKVERGLRGRGAGRGITLILFFSRVRREAQGTLASANSAVSCELLPNGFPPRRPQRYAEKTIRLVLPGRFMAFWRTRHLWGDVRFWKVLERPLGLLGAGRSGAIAQRAVRGLVYSRCSRVGPSQVERRTISFRQSSGFELQSAVRKYDFVSGCRMFCV